MKKHTDDEMIAKFKAIIQKYKGSNKPMDIDTVNNAEGRIAYFEENKKRQERLANL